MNLSDFSTFALVRNFVNMSAGISSVSTLSSCTWPARMRCVRMCQRRKMCRARAALAFRAAIIIDDCESVPIHVGGAAPAWCARWISRP